LDNLKAFVDKRYNTETDSFVWLAKHISDEDRKNGLSKKKLAAICYWKSPRPKKLVELNSEEEVERITREAFEMFRNKQGELAIKKLCQGELRGVKARTASAILAIVFPDKFAIYDKYLKDIVKEFLGDTFEFTPNEITRYAAKLCQEAQKFGVTPRALEYSLFVEQQYRDQTKKLKINFLKCQI